MKVKEYNWTDVNEEYILNLRKSGEMVAANLFEKILNNPERREDILKNSWRSPSV